MWPVVLGHAGAAITRVDMGDDPAEVMRDAVAELARRGLETVDYRSGRRTTVDAAVRRHIDSQLNQAANDMAVRQCEEWGVGLVMVDAHWGARPSHAAWQGKAYSLHGRVEVDGVTYEDLYEATGYQGRNGWPQGARLAGVNCRHRIYPYVPGESRIPSDDFDAMARKYGMTSEEYYRETQRQRSLERELRAAKREAAFLEDEGLDATAQRYRIGDLQRRLRELCRTTGLERDPTRERAYGVTHQPRGLTARYHPQPSESKSILRAETIKAHEFVKGAGQSVKKVTRDAEKITLKSGQTIFVAKGTPTEFRDDLIRQFRKLPRKLKDTVRTIDVVDFENPDDAMWAKQVEDFDKSVATGGRGTITFYSPGLSVRGGDLLGYVAHEAGHCLDDSWRSASSGPLSWSSEWSDAITEDEERTGTRWITSYAERHRRRSEDLADSVKWLIRAKNNFGIEVETKQGKMPIEVAFSSRMSLLREVLGFD